MSLCGSVFSGSQSVDINKSMSMNDPNGRSAPPPPCAIGSELVLIVMSSLVVSV